jgi:hypothetical protein
MECLPLVSTSTYLPSIAVLNSYTQFKIHCHSIVRLSAQQ